MNCALRIGSLAAFLFLAPFSVYAESVPVQVLLDTITLHQGSEKGGDELYFNVTTYAQARDYDHYQVPSFPAHWFSDRLEEVSEVMLWNGEVPEGESVEVILSLTERDVPPWNIDDHVGSVKVKFNNNDGDVSQEWTVYADRGHTELLKEKREYRMYKMSGSGAEYDIILRTLVDD